MKFTFLSELREKFMEKFDKLNKKLARLGEKAEIVSETEKEVEVLAPVGWWNQSRICDKRKKKQTTIEIKPPEITARPGTEYLGTVSVAKGVRQTYSENPEYILGEQELRCDHCKINRKRNKYFFFLENGEIKSIGSTCVLDYFGYDIEKMLNVYTKGMQKLVDELEEIEEYHAARPECNGLFIPALIPLVAFETQKGYWTSKSNGSGKIPTASLIVEDYGDMEDKRPDEETKARKEEIAKFITSLPIDFIDNVLDKCKELYSKPESDFDYNIRYALFDPDGNFYEYTKATGIVCFALFQAIHPDWREKKDEPRKESNFVGEIGEKIEASVEVVFTKVCESRWGSSLLVIMVDGNGNKFSWFARDDWEEWENGTKTTIKATVKRHDNYQGTRTTYLNRVTKV